MAVEWEGAPKLRGLSPEEILIMALEGREMFNRLGIVPADSVASLAIARVLRESGEFGAAAARLVAADTPPVSSEEQLIDNYDNNL